jgi:protein-S-isoprenylcysteine O-methyltransferase Ste14
MTGLPDLGRRGEGWVVIQVVLLVVVVGAGMLGPSWDGVARVASSLAGLALISAGGVLVVRGSTDLRGSLTPLPHPRDGASLVDTGIYARARHPIYGGIILGAIGWGLLTASVPALGLAAVTSGFFLLKSTREEAWLIERFPDYPAYRQRTRRFIPWIG